MGFNYRNDELRKYLEEKKCFKLICGANNENYVEIEKLVKLYSRAGVKFFDINASKKALITAKNALNNKKDCFICVSIGTKNDPHLAKCKINSNCISCKKCSEICPQKAIKINSKTEIIEKNCIGCKKCLSVCKNNAIESYQKELQIDKILSDIKSADCIEFHIITNDKKEIFEKWEYLVKNYDGFLSIALNRSLFSDREMFEILSKMLDIAKDKDVMLQADGLSMSGGVDDYNSTLQAVATADVIIKSGINTPVIISGGTNSKSFELAKLCKVDIFGVAIGSFARKIVRDYLDFDDYDFNKALKIAEKLVKSSGGN